MSTSNSDSGHLLQQFQAGRGEAATAIFNRYVERLLALARTRLGAAIRRRVDAEDVVQSAYRSFFAHATDGQYQVTEPGDLWRLLAAITLNKLHGQIERHAAAKRAMGREEATDVSLARHRSVDPTPAEVVGVIEQLTLVLAKLSPDERAVLTATLQGQPADQVSESMGKSERTVRRHLAHVRQQIEKHLLESQVPSPAEGDRPDTARVTAHAPLRHSDYALQELIGSGAMGKIYRATENSTGRTVAIKALHKSRQSDPRAVSLFIQEAELLTRLRHPNIVGTRGLGRFPAGGFFIVMDFVDGEDLQSQLQRGPLPAAQAVPLVIQVAGAIAHAHDQGVVHCDLKPANILLGRNRRTVVTDFGFAFLIAGKAKASLARIGGTAGFMAPEVLDCLEPPTPAADIFGLGAVLWTLCLGTAPDLRNLSAHSKQLPAAVAAICSRCLAPIPEDRYKSVGRLISELQGVQEATD